MYAIKQDIIDRYGEDVLFEIFDRDESGLYDETSVTKALQGASDRIDGFIGGSYELPLINPPAYLKDCAIDIALYMGADNSTAHEERRTRYEDCISWLKLVAKGDVQLPVTPPDATSDQAASVAPARVFSRENMENY